MAESNNHGELDHLLSRLANGDATPEDIEELEARLDGDQAAQQRYVHYLDLHAELADRAAQSDPSLVPGGTDKKSLSRLVLSFALAASVLLAVGVMLGNWIGGRTNSNLAAPTEPAERTDDGVAVLTHAVDVEWLSDNPPQPEEILSPGRLQFRQGLVQIEFYSGARLLVSGPADLEIVSVNRAICRTGKMRAFVPPLARGFTIVSSQFELVDQGTEFAMQVDEHGESLVHVFDGEVELYPPGDKRAIADAQRLFGGDGVAWDAAGKQSKFDVNVDEFPSFKDVRELKQTASQRRFAVWKKWSQALKDNPRVAVYYDFEEDGGTLLDRCPLELHGVVIGCERVSGRWQDKGALEFKRPSDRVRVELPGSYDTITFSAWIRVDALTDRPQGLLLTDGYEIGRVHWQISPEGTLRLGVRLPSEKRKLLASGYGSPVLFSPRRLGIWSFLGTVYDRRAGEVRHYLNGHEVSTEKLVFDQPLQIGVGEIGNWGVPIGRDEHVIRNFVGRIDEFIIWNTALTGDEIRDIYWQTRP